MKCLHFQGSSLFFFFFYYGTFETPGMTRPTTQRYIPYDQNPLLRCRNLESRMELVRYLQYPIAFTTASFVLPGL